MVGFCRSWIVGGFIGIVVYGIVDAAAGVLLLEIVRPMTSWAGSARKT